MRRSAVLVVFAVVPLAACRASAGPPGPVVSPTGVVYEPGTPPEETRTSQTATLYLRQGRHARALDLALEGIGEESTNPVHYFLAGAAYARLGDLAGADSMFTLAEGIYPAYELETEPEREAAWGAAFNSGLEAYETGDAERAIDLWNGATRLFDLRPEAHRNLASLLALEGRYDEAIDTYQAGLAGLERRPVTRVLDDPELEERRRSAATMEDQLLDLLMTAERFGEAEPILRRRLERAPDDVELRSDLARALEGTGRVEEAERLYRALLAEQGLEGTQLFNLGVALFRSSEYEGAVEAFRRLTESQPASRDAWFNYANALFAAEAWDRLAVVGHRLIELEPLGENALLITARAHLELGDREAARATLQVAESSPVFLDGLRFRRGTEGTRVEGEIEGNRATGGTPVRVLFSFYGDRGELLATEGLTAHAPAPGARTPFSVDSGTRAAYYHYQVVR